MVSLYQFKILCLGFGDVGKSLTWTQGASVNYGVPMDTDNDRLLCGTTRGPDNGYSPDARATGACPKLCDVEGSAVLTNWPQAFLLRLADRRIAIAPAICLPEVGPFKSNSLLQELMSSRWRLSPTLTGHRQSDIRALLPWHHTAWQFVCG